MQETDLSEVVGALKSRDEIHNILSHPIPSMTQIVNDAERISAALHHDFEHHEAPQGRPPCNLIHLMTNIIQQLEEYQPESDVGPALHAARQVAYLSSIFISMVSNNAATIPSSNLSNPAVFATPSNSHPSSSQPTAPFQHQLSSHPQAVNLLSPSQLQSPFRLQAANLLFPSQHQALFHLQSINLLNQAILKPSSHLQAVNILCRSIQQPSFRLQAVHLLCPFQHQPSSHLQAVNILRPSIQQASFRLQATNPPSP